MFALEDDKDRNCGRCWEFWRCREEEKKNCRCHNADLGDWCWMVNEAFLPKKARHFEDCRYCGWYKMRQEEKGFDPAMFTDDAEDL